MTGPSSENLVFAMAILGQAFHGDLDRMALAEFAKEVEAWNEVRSVG